MTEISSIELAGRRLTAERLAAREKKRDELAAYVEVTARALDDLEPPPQPPPAVTAHDMFWASISATLVGAAPSLACLTLSETPTITLDTSTLAGATIVVFGALSVAAQRQLAEQSDHAVQSSRLSFSWPLLAFAGAGVLSALAVAFSTGSSPFMTLLGLASVSAAFPMMRWAHERARTRRAIETFPQRHRAAEQRLERARAALSHWEQAGQHEHQERTTRLTALFDPERSKPHVATASTKTNRPIIISESA